MITTAEMIIGAVLCACWGALIAFMVADWYIIQPAMKGWKESIDRWADLIKEGIELKLRIRQYERDCGIKSPLQVENTEKR